MLVLGRISNLPTVWSNCTAAWLLGGGGSAWRLMVLCGSATLLYTGGMFLNDAFDANFDREHRRERPIPSGRIEERTVRMLGNTFLAAGLLLTFLLGLKCGAFGTALVACIVIYDAVHKRFVLSPLLMGGCRFLLYLTAASAAGGNVEGAVVWGALVMMAYIVGLSCLARGESVGGVASRWPIALLLTPVALALIRCATDCAATWTAAAILSGWLLWNVRGALSNLNQNLSGSVPGLLAGIALVDWLAVAGIWPITGPLFVALFAFALVLQRIAPAT